MNFDFLFFMKKKYLFNEYEYNICNEYLLHYTCVNSIYMPLAKQNLKKRGGEINCIFNFIILEFIPKTTKQLLENITAIKLYKLCKNNNYKAF